VQVWIWLDE